MNNYRVNSSADYAFFRIISTREWRRSGIEKPPRTAVAEARLQTKNYGEAGASPVPRHYFFFLAAFLAFFLVAIGIASLLNLSLEG